VKDVEEKPVNPYAAPSLTEPTRAAPKEEGHRSSRPLATKTSRLLAAIIDSVITGAIVVPIVFVPGVIEFLESMPIVAEQVASFVFGCIVFLLLHGYLLATRGQSIGKLCMGIQIVDYNTEELLPLWKLVVMRNIVMSLIDLIPLIGSIIGLIDILMIFGEERRCLHDHLAGTKVVETLPQSGTGNSPEIFKP